MKNPKKLTRKHKKFLSEQGLNPEEFLIMQSTSENYKFFHRNTKQIVDIRR
ncbi:DUF6906 family protein [Clostridium intestinale]|uniref:DUF6906 family protein n=1 Tax=Clostridium intestinale TaxID=36845 RepID=UPI002DD6B5E8|nr:hypothetical protein [Clostridium intestinale]WRY49503.1 hypothetical protein P8F83_12285 [Clostridium intestinale]